MEATGLGPVAFGLPIAAATCFAAMVTNVASRTVAFAGLHFLRGGLNDRGFFDLPLGAAPVAFFSGFLEEFLISFENISDLGVGAFGPSFSV